MMIVYERETGMEPRKPVLPGVCKGRDKGVEKILTKGEERGWVKE